MEKKKNMIIMLFILLLLVIGLCIYIFFARDNKKTENLDISNDKQIGMSFPYKDDKGRIRYKMIVNGKELETKNFPFKLKDEEKGAYFPIKDILNYLDVDVLENDNKTILVTKINNNILRVSAEQGEMVYGKTTLQAIDESVKTILVDNVLYVPSFFFMKFTNNTIVDFSSDYTSATLITDLVIDPSISWITEVALTDTIKENLDGNTNKTHICSKCSGAGGYNESYYNQYLVNGQYMQQKQYRWITCSLCGGTGHVHN